MRVSTVATADAQPTWVFSKKFWYEKYDGTFVAAPGPPRVGA